MAKTNAERQKAYRKKSKTLSMSIDDFTDSDLEILSVYLGKTRKQVVLSLIKKAYQNLITEGLSEDEREKVIDEALNRAKNRSGANHKASMTNLDRQLDKQLGLKD